jgi:nucleoside-diphosphate-sugar epimerase
MWKHNKKIIFSGLERRGDPIKWQADISVLKSYGYEQSVILNDGLERYIEWAKNEILG